MQKKIHIVVHEPLEDAGNIKIWTAKNNISIQHINVYAGDVLPNPEGIDMVAVMGGSMSVWEVDKYPWIILEKEWIAKIIELKVPVIGICFGAQLIAEVLGGCVEKNNYIEIGFVEIKKTEELSEESLIGVLPESFEMFEWHGDKCVLPNSALLLANSEGCDCQAFEYNGHVLGVQFHPEYNVDSVKNNLIKSPDALKCGGKYVQGSDEIFAKLDSFEQMVEYLCKLLDRLFLSNH